MFGHGAGSCLCSSLCSAQLLLARAEGSLPASLALWSPHPRLFQDHRSIPHHTALSKVVSLPWLLSSSEPGMLGCPRRCPGNQPSCFPVDMQDAEVGLTGNSSPGIPTLGCEIPAKGLLSLSRMLLMLVRIVETVKIVKTVLGCSMDVHPWFWGVPLLQAGSR